MQTPTPPPSTLVSPSSKRKRPLVDATSDDSPSPTRLKTTDLPSRPSLDNFPGNERSPRATVAKHLQNLELEEPNIPDENEYSPTRKKGKESRPSPEPESFLQNVQRQKQQFPGQDNLPNIDTAPTTIPRDDEDRNHRPLNQANLETPGPSSITTSNDIVPQSSTPTDPFFSQTVPSIKSPPLPSPPSPPTSTNSPTTAGLWWTSTEITGHTLSDPMDDGYGINGVGFVPTPAMATARAEKRRRQVREWKEREAREARGRRAGERGRRGAKTTGPALAASTAAAAVPSTTPSTEGGVELCDRPLTDSTTTGIAAPGMEKNSTAMVGVAMGSGREGNCAGEGVRAEAGVRGERRVRFMEV